MRARARGSGRLVERLRRICLALPEAREKLSHGEPTWFAGKGKAFAMLDDHHHGAAHLSVLLPQPFGAQEALIASNPGRFFRPPYVGPSGWVGVVIDESPDWSEVERMVREAYLHVAAPKLRKLVVPGGGPGSARPARPVARAAGRDPAAGEHQRAAGGVPGRHVDGTVAAPPARR